jgi:hypothetical protein
MPVAKTYCPASFAGTVNSLSVERTSLGSNLDASQSFPRLITVGFERSETIFQDVVQRPKSP